MPSSARAAPSYAVRRQRRQRPPPANVAYLQFCQNSPTLCAGVVPERPEAGYVQFCQNNPVLCTKPN